MQPFTCRFAGTDLPIDDIAAVCLLVTKNQILSSRFFLNTKTDTNMAACIHASHHPWSNPLLLKTQTNVVFLIERNNCNNVFWYFRFILEFLPCLKLLQVMV